MKDEASLHLMKRERKSDNRRSSILKRQDTCVISEGSDQNSDGPRTPRRVSFASTAMIREFRPTPWHFNASDESFCSTGTNSDTSTCSRLSSTGSDDAFVADPGQLALVKDETVSPDSNLSSENQPIVLVEAIKGFIHDVETDPKHSSSKQNQTILYAENMDESMCDMDIISDNTHLHQSIHIRQVDYLDVADNEARSAGSMQNHTILFSEMDKSVCDMNITANISRMTQSWMLPINDENYRNEITRKGEVILKPGLNRRPSFSDNRIHEIGDDRAFMELSEDIEDLPERTRVFSEEGGEEIEITRNITYTFSNENQHIPVESYSVIPQNKPKLLDDLFKLIKKPQPTSIMKNHIEDELTQESLEDMDVTDFSQGMSRVALSDITIRKALTPIAEMSVASTNVSVAESENRYTSKVFLVSQSQSALSNVQKTCSKLEQIYGTHINSNPAKKDCSIEKENMHPSNKENDPALILRNKSHVETILTKQQTTHFGNNSLYTNASGDSSVVHNGKTGLCHIIDNEIADDDDDPEIAFKFHSPARIPAGYEEIKSSSGKVSNPKDQNETSVHIEHLEVMKISGDKSQKSVMESENREATKPFHGLEDVMTTYTKTIHSDHHFPQCEYSNEQQAACQHDMAVISGKEGNSQKCDTVKCVSEMTQIFDNNLMDMTEHQTKTIYIGHNTTTESMKISQCDSDSPERLIISTGNQEEKTYIFDNSEMEMTECETRTIGIRNNDVESKKNSECANNATCKAVHSLREEQGKTHIFDNGQMEMTECQTKTIYIGSGASKKTMSGLQFVNDSSTKMTTATGKQEEKTCIFDNNQMEMTECQARTIYTGCNADAEPMQKLQLDVSSIKVTTDTGKQEEKTHIFDNNQMEMTECQTKTICLGRDVDLVNSSQFAGKASTNRTYNRGQGLEKTEIFDNNQVEMIEDETKTIYLGNSECNSNVQTGLAFSTDLEQKMSQRFLNTHTEMIEKCKADVQKHSQFDKKVPMKLSVSRQLSEKAQSFESSQMETTNDVREKPHLVSDVQTDENTLSRSIPVKIISTDDPTEMLTDTEIRRHLQFIREQSSKITTTAMPTSFDNNETSTMMTEDTLDNFNNSKIENPKCQNISMHPGHNGYNSVRKYPLSDSKAQVASHKSTGAEKVDEMNNSSTEFGVCLTKGIYSNSQFANKAKTKCTNPETTYSNSSLAGMRGLEMKCSKEIQNSSYTGSFVTSFTSDVMRNSQRCNSSQVTTLQNTMKTEKVVSKCMDYEQSGERNRTFTDMESGSTVVHGPTKRCSPSNSQDRNDIKKKRINEHDIGATPKTNNIHETLLISETAESKDLELKKKREELRRSLCKEIGLPLAFSQRSTTFDPFQKRKSCNFDLLFGKGDKDKGQPKMVADFNKSVTLMNSSIRRADQKVSLPGNSNLEDSVFGDLGCTKGLPTFIYEHSSSSSSSQSLASSKPTSAEFSHKDQAGQPFDESLLDQVLDSSEMLINQEMPELTEDMLDSCLVKKTFEHEEDSSLILDLDFISQMEQSIPLPSKQHMPSVFQDVCEMFDISRAPQHLVRHVAALRVPTSTVREKLIAKVTSVPQVECLQLFVRELDTAVSRARQETKDKLMHFSNRPPEVYMTALKARECGKDTEFQALLNACRISAKAKWKQRKADYLMKYLSAREAAHKMLDAEVKQVISETEKATHLIGNIDKCLLEIDLISAKKKELEAQQQELEKIDSEVQDLKLQSEKQDERLATLIKTNAECAERQCETEAAQQENQAKLSWLQGLTEWTILKNTETNMHFGFLFGTLVLQIKFMESSQQEKISEISLQSRLGAEKTKPWARLAHKLAVSSINCEQLQHTYMLYDQMNELLTKVSAIICYSRHLSSELRLAHLKHQVSIKENRLVFVVSDRKTLQRIQLNTCVAPNTYPLTSWQWMAEVLEGNILVEEVVTALNQVPSGYKYITRILQKAEQLLAQCKR